MNTEIKILPSVRREIHTKLAQFCTEENGSDLYHLMQAFEIIRSIVGDEPLKEYYKEKYQIVKKRLYELNIRLQHLKLYYDTLKLGIEEVQKYNFKLLFDDEFKKVPLISKTLFNCFNILLSNTDIRFLPIPNECFKAVDREEKILLSTTKDENKE